jgi:hypothetical protein
MKPSFRRSALAGLAVAACTFAAVAAPVGAAGSGKVVVFNLTESPLFKPKNFYLSANAGPALVQLRWDNWGKAKTTATGIYVSDCPSCGPEERKPAIVTFSGLKPCPKYDGQTYRTGTLTTIADDGTKTKSSLTPSRSFHCK